MPAATIIGGALVPIEDCYIIIPCSDCGMESSEFVLRFKVLPEISDSKTVSYNDEQVIGRASPLKTYAQSDNRTLSVQIHMVVSEASDVDYNLMAMRAIQSAAYPRKGANGAPFVPPPICRMKCGLLLSGGQELCVVLKSYSVKFPTEIAWDEQTLLPYKFDIDTSWDVVYKSSELPGQERIFTSGR
jgi:hypothetical protein